MMVASALSATTSKAFGAVTRSAGWGTTSGGAAASERKRGVTAAEGLNNKRRDPNSDDPEQTEGGRGHAAAAPAAPADDAAVTRTPPPSSASKTRKSVTLSLPNDTADKLSGGANGNHDSKKKLNGTAAGNQQHTATAAASSTAAGASARGGRANATSSSPSPTAAPGGVASSSPSSAFSTPMNGHSTTANGAAAGPPVTAVTSLWLSTSRSDELKGKKVDRFGFIQNMDANGNLLSDDDDDLNDNDEYVVSRRANYSPSRLGRPHGGSSVSSPSSPLHRVVPSRLAPYSDIQRNERREHKWERMIETYYDRNRIPPRNLLLRRCRKGLPHAIRGRVWKLLGGVPSKIVDHPGLYNQLVRKTVVVGATANGSVDVNSSTGLLTPLIMPPSCAQPSATDTATVALVTAASPPQSSSPTGSGGGDDMSTSVAEPMNHTKSFRNLQDTIERDIHRTFPRHSLFYEESDAASVVAEHEINGGGQGGLPVGLCGTTVISSMIRELELGQQQELGLASSYEQQAAAAADLVLSAQGGQASLRRVLKAYSLYDREIGYCQGMNFIAGMFLTLMSEEEAFWLLVAAMQNDPCRMRGLFGEGMKETHQVLFVAERLIHQFLPRLAKHLDKEHIHITMFATQWLLTQYTSSFKFDLVLRVWDCFLAEGWKATYRVMLCLLQKSQSDLLKMSFEDILAYFRELPDRVNGNAIVDDAVKIPLKRKHIIQYEREWQRTQQPQQS